MRGSSLSPDTRASHSPPRPSERPQPTLSSPTTSSCPNDEATAEANTTDSAPTTTAHRAAATTTTTSPTPFATRASIPTRLSPTESTASLTANAPTSSSASTSTAAWTRRLTLPARSVTHPDFFHLNSLSQNRAAANYGRMTEASVPIVGHVHDAMAERRSSLTHLPRASTDASSPQGPALGSQQLSAGAHHAQHQPLGRENFALPGLSATSSLRSSDAQLGSKQTETESQRHLNKYREKLSQHMERREHQVKNNLANASEKAPISPIYEEAASNSPMLSAPLTTTSTESGHTVRGGMTPAFMAGTPSYPFPRMAALGGFASHYLNKYLPSTSPTSPNPASPMRSPEYHGSLDRVLSENSTPASTLHFHPSTSPHPGGNFDFPTPNLYDLSLMLSAEPGLDAWWSTVVQIMRDVYKAERVTLAVPADTTDIENVPWGQKATYNQNPEDELSLGYVGVGSSTGRSSELEHTTLESWTNSEEVVRPPASARPLLPSRHSFTSYEDNRRKTQDAHNVLPARRPATLTRSKTHGPQSHRQGDNSLPRAKLDKKALDEHDAVEEQHVPDIPSWEAPFRAHYEGQGEILPVLQALDYEADPLIDHVGVARVLQRGKAVALTRSYPYLAKAERLSIDATVNSKSNPKSAGSESLKSTRKQRSESISKLSSIFSSSAGSRGSTRGRVHFSDTGMETIASSHLEEGDQRPPTPRYEEYEQAPPSPWSQSPAPSPAVRPDPQENPFFTDAMVDEDSFNPETGSGDYTGIRPPEAIGIDNSWTVLHIPLTHMLLSKPTRQFKLDATAIEQKSFRNKDDQGPDYRESETTAANSDKTKPAPIAILSILSPLIPYPSNLRHSLEHLAPHMATSFSLCRHYSNLETELAGIQRRRPPTTGFGAVAPYNRSLESSLAMTTGRLPQHQSLAGSMTSPSDHSAISKSAAGSPIGTPGWDQPSLGYIMDKRHPAASPAATFSGAESYFSSKQKTSTARQDVLGSLHQRSRAASRENLSADSRMHRLSGNTVQDKQDNEETISRLSRSSESLTALSQRDSQGEKSIKSSQRASMGSLEESLEESLEDSGEKLAHVEDGEAQHEHTMLHSYGADFASTFQSLPPSSTVTASTKPGASLPSRSGSVANSTGEMPPPSDRLKGLMLDSLPAHVFVALPQTGEIVWVNSRFLSYRGQTVANLASDPWGSIHRDDRKEYLKAWGHSLRTGEQFSRTVRIKRFDGSYRWFYARAVASKDKRGVIMQFLGSYMDIHDQHIAELKAARQEEIEASEAKHRLLANLIPQIIFTATEDDGITFANEQWLSYTGQDFEDALALGFMDHVHPDDLAKCRVPLRQLSNATSRKSESDEGRVGVAGAADDVPPRATQSPRSAQEQTLRGAASPLTRSDSSGSNAIYDLPTPELTELARKGVIKVATDANGRVSYTTEVRLRSKAGEYRWHLVRCVEIDTIDFGQGASSYFGSATDINDHKLLEAKLKEAMESKGRFLSNMSHEIRTPLIGISGMVSFLQDTILNEEQRDYSNTIQTSANSLIMIINDILDLSKVDAGMMKLKYEWFHTRSLIEDVNELVSTMAIAKRLELNYLVEADVPAWVKGDKVRIRQVLLNVIGNAIKFTSEGEVFSRCKVLAEENASRDEIVLQFSIIDTGQGFSKKEAELIFKPFSQIDGSSTRQHGGSGLGLVISRQLVELHGGKMDGTAELGKGSTFTFTARFSLPTRDDHPTFPGSPDSTISATSRRGSLERSPKTIKPPYPVAQKYSPEDVSPKSNPMSPNVVSHASSGSSLHPDRIELSDRSSVNTGLAQFSEAAKASGQDLTQMKLELPLDRGSPKRSSTPKAPDRALAEKLRPLMYSILIICPQYHSREATTQHIEMTLPKDVPHQIIALGTVEEAQQYIGGEDAVKFTHAVINLKSVDEIVNVMDQITESQKVEKMTILILSDSVQRQAFVRQATGTKYERLLSDNLVTFIYKPVKPSRFAVIFDPEKVRDLSTDRNRSTAQQMVENQKASYQEIERRMGNKGYKVLLVEDNLVNQKVLTKYLEKIGVEVEIAIDGVECTDRVLSKPHSHFSLILCDLHMPRKDGYQACRDIRQWEKVSGFPHMPIIALSANVMSDVQEKCVAAGFSDYVTKPVDFIDLSRAMARFF